MNWFIETWRKIVPKEPPFLRWSITERRLLRFLKKTVDVRPLWATEAIHAKASGLSFDVVEPGEGLDQRNRINSY